MSFNSLIQKIVISNVAILSIFSGIASVNAVVITNPVYPGTNIPYAYRSWNCTHLEQGTNRALCSVGSEFTPPRYTHLMYYLSEIGVCKSLGYENAVLNSSTSDGTTDSRRRIWVDPTGKVVGAVSGSTLTSIECENPIAVFSAKEIHINDDPRDVFTNLRFSFPKVPGKQFFTLKNPAARASDINAICKRLYPALNTRGIDLSTDYDGNDPDDYQKTQPQQTVKALNDGSLSLVTSVPTIRIYCIEN